MIFLLPAFVVSLSTYYSTSLCHSLVAYDFICFCSNLFCEILLHLKMLTIPVEEFEIPLNQDIDVLKSWTWFMSLFSDEEWKKRKLAIEQKISIEERTGEPCQVSVLSY
jgi:hypothetical protein